MKMQGWGIKTIAGLGVFAGWFLACAGDDIPPIDDQLRSDIVNGFGGAPVSMAGAGSGTAGRGGSGPSNSGGGNAGSNAGSANSGGSDSGGGAAGAGGGGEPVGGGEPECDAFPILQMSCGLANCHNAGATQGGFAENEDDILDFVDEPSTKGASCDGVFIDSANPEESLIYTRLFEAGCGNLSMPLTGTPLTDEQSECVLGWLQQFAE